jgi:hypothetical protein
VLTDPARGLQSLIINMTTLAARKEHYIDRTIESLLQSDGRDLPLNIIAGSFDSSHIQRYKEVANIVAWDEEAQSQAIEGRLRRNCTVNAIRALAYGEDDHCLCCEDDVHFDKHWYSQLMLTVAEIYNEEYVLNLAQPGDSSPGKRYAIDTRVHMVGAQGIFYPSKSLRNAVTKYVRNNIRKGMNDTLIGKFAKLHAVLYRTTPPLIAHIGQVSCFH